MSTATASSSSTASSRALVPSLASWELPLRRGPYLTGTAGTDRLSGIDAARGLAVLGMVVAHTGATTWGVTSIPGLLSLAHGRSSILFATIAGLSVGLMSGRQHPHRGEQLVRTRTRLLTRSALLLVLGTLMTMLLTPVIVILGFYAAWLTIVLPFLTWTPRRLFSLSAATAVVGPVLVQTGPTLLQAMDVDTEMLGDDGSAAVLSFLLTGAYPGLVWMAYILLGLGLSRLDLGSARTLRRLAATGVLCAVLGYGGAVAVGQALVPDDHDVIRVISPASEESTGKNTGAEGGKQTRMETSGGTGKTGEAGEAGQTGKTRQTGNTGQTGAAGGEEAAQAASPGQGSRSGSASLPAESAGPPAGSGTPVKAGSADADLAEDAPGNAPEDAPGDTPGGTASEDPWSLTAQEVLAGLVTAAPHSNTLFEALGSGGVAMTVIALAQLVARRHRLLLAPLAAVGSMSLTVYCAHIVVIGAWGLGVPETASNATAGWICLAAVVFAMEWFTVFARGPLEHVVHVISVRAATPRE